MKSLPLLTMFGLILGSASVASAQVQGFMFNFVSFDENGMGTYQVNNNLSTPLPYTIAAGNVLTYQLPSAVTPGDVLLNDGFAVTGAPVIGDVIRFTANDSIQFYSDSGPNDPPYNLADFAPFPTFFNLNQVTIGETGPEGNNGAVYVPNPGQPGFVPGITMAYGIISDSPVPEASSCVSLGVLLALGLGGFVIARKRKSVPSA